MSAEGDSLASLGERACIERLVGALPDREDVIVGPGDDCAVVRQPGAHNDLLLTSDPLIQDVHFRISDPAQGIGHKAAGRALSDIAAMGGSPLWMTINLVAPRSTPVSLIELIYTGAGALCRKHRTAIVGGDVSEGPALELHVFAVGSVPLGKAILRSGGRSGDQIFVTGQLGGSSSGRHLAFRPRIEEGCWLRQYATAMIDLSDGIASDIQHIANQSGCGATIKVEALPLSQDITDDADAPWTHALTDGEDFELLFTVPSESVGDVQQSWPAHFPRCTRIGEIAPAQQGIHYLGSDGKQIALDHSGFEHFTS